MNKYKPTNIVADRRIRTLMIEWSDGHTSVYPYDGLRLVCPCVECRGGHAHMGQPIDPQILASSPDSGIMLDEIRPVGSYAIQLQWSDGHNTGIYTWRLLRDGCPCDVCFDQSNLDR